MKYGITFLLGLLFAFTAGAAPVVAVAAGATLSAGRYLVADLPVYFIGTPLYTGVDVSNLTTDFVEFGGKIWSKEVNEWNVDPFISVYKGVKKPQVLPKLSAVGGPRPYRSQDDTNGNGAEFTDRTLIVYQSKWDYDVDPEVFRNKYLAQKQDVPFYEFILQQVAKEYKAAINDSTMLDGEYDAAGTTAADLADGFGTLIREAIGDGDLAEIATGAITGSNAVTKIEQVADALPAWMKDKEVTIFCSWTVFQFYRTHYRATYGFNFQKRDSGEYMLDAYANIRLKPMSWMGTSLGVIATIKDVLIVGTDGDAVTLDATKRRNIIEVRQMMPIGFQIADLGALFVNDQFTP